MLPLRYARLQYRAHRDDEVHEPLYNDEENPSDRQKKGLRSPFQRCCRVVVVIPCLLLVTIIVTGLIAMGESPRPPTESSSSYFRYSTVTGYFLQDDPNTDPQTFDYISTNFGLIGRSYDTDAQFDPDSKKTQWERFEHKVRVLNKHADHGTQYKVLFMGRHGEGYHNVAEGFYGTEAWDCYWSLLDGNETMIWDDARLTEVGQAQAKAARGAWEKHIQNKIPFPKSFYVSPLNRCLETASMTFDGLEKDAARPFRPVVKELLRETLGIHTCDRRSTKSVIESEYPLYRIEPGFSETDTLWDPHLRESNSARSARLKQFLDDVFTHHDNNDVQFVSFTAHSGAITSILSVVQHRTFGLATGAVIPVLVKAERVQGEAPPVEIEPGTPAPSCKADPTTTSMTLGLGSLALSQA